MIPDSLSPQDCPHEDKHLNPLDDQHIVCLRCGARFPRYADHHAAIEAARSTLKITRSEPDRTPLDLEMVRDFASDHNTDVVPYWVRELLVGLADELDACRSRRR